jgi:hypothetical protein
MDNVFDCINEKMFSLLTAEDKRGNYELLRILYHLSESVDYGDFIPKEEAVGALTSFLEDHSGEVKESGDGEDISRRSARDKAQLKLRQFRALGWVNEESLGGYNALISFTSAGKAVMEFLTSFTARAEQPLEYTGYVYVIYSTLKNFDLSKSTALLQQVYRLTKELMNALSRLSSEIKEFLDALMDNPDLSPRQILSTLLGKYQSQVILRVFNNLRMRDNPSRYSSEIIATLRSLVADHMEEMVANSVLVDDVKDLTKERYESIENQIRDEISYVITSFEGIEKYLDVVDAQNAKYLSSTKARLDFLLTSTKDVTGRIADCLKAIAETPDDYPFESLVCIESSGIIDARSLSSPRFQRDKPVAIELPVPEGDQGEVESGLERIFGDDPYSKENINEAALSFLGGESEMSSKDIPTEDEARLIILMMMQLISQDRGLNYSLDFKENPYVRAGHEIKEFQLKKKERNNARQK